jgi:tetratricopeptide (TPR) repeat protein
LRHIGRLDEAEALCRAVLDLDQKNFWALMALGNLARERGNHTAAFSWFEAASGTNPAHSGARQDFAAAALDADRLDVAEAVFKKALDQEPSDIRSLMGLGYLARKRGDRAAG